MFSHLIYTPACVLCSPQPMYSACPQPTYPEALAGSAFSYPARHVHALHLPAESLFAEYCQCTVSLHCVVLQLVLRHSCAPQCQLTYSMSMQASFRRRRGPCHVSSVLRVSTKIRAIVGRGFYVPPISLALAWVSTHDLLNHIDVFKKTQERSRLPQAQTPKQRAKPVRWTRSSHSLVDLNRDTVQLVRRIPLRMARAWKILPIVSARLGGLDLTAGFVCGAKKASTKQVQGIWPVTNVRRAST